MLEMPSATNMEARLNVDISDTSSMLRTRQSHASSIKPFFYVLPVTVGKSKTGNHIRKDGQTFTSRPTTAEIDLPQTHPSHAFKPSI